MYKLKRPCRAHSEIRVGVNLRNAHDLANVPQWDNYANVRQGNNKQYES